MATTAARQVAVFWDFENCRPSFTVSGSKLIDKIRRLIEGYGSITVFKAYVDLSEECINPKSYTLHSELQSSGLTLVHCPHNGKKDVADKMMIVDMLAFAIDTPPPATIAIITGDRDFAYAAATLRLRGYRIIAIAPNTSHVSLKMQADRVFDWQRDIISANDLSPEANCFVPMQTYKASQHTADTSLGSTPSQRLPAMIPEANIRLPAWLNGRTSLSHMDSNRGSGSPLPLSQQAIFSQTHSHTREEYRSAVEHSPYNNIVPEGKGLSTYSSDLPPASTQTTIEETHPSDISELHHTRTTVQSDAVAPAFEPLLKGSPTFSLLEAVISVPSSSIESESLSPSMKGWSLAGSEYSSPGFELVALNDQDFSTSSNLDSSFTSTSLDSKDSTTPADETPPASIINDNGLATLIEPAIELPAMEVELERPQSCLAVVPFAENLPLPSNIPSGSPNPPASTHEPLLESETSVPPSSTDNASSSELKPESIISSKPPHTITRESIKQFQPLITFFIEMKAWKGATRFLSSEVAAGIMKRDPNVYQRAGVIKLKQYIEEARKAGVIISPGMDNMGNAWVEINPQLYPPAGASKALEPTPLTGSKANSSAKPNPSPNPPIEAYFSPLIVRLRAEKQSYRLLFSQIGEFIKTQHPGLYKKASVAGLSKYLTTAESRGIIRIGGSSGRQWAELMPAHRQPPS